MAEWYYQYEGKEVGPISFEELERKADQGEIDERTLVRQGSEGPWVAASSVQGLFVEPVVGGTIAVVPESEASSEPEAQVRTPSDTVPDQDHEIHRSPLTMRPCSDCGRMVSQKASICPFCGRSFQELTLTIPYRGEHPIPVWALFIALAVVFMFASPVVVHQAALKFATNTLGDEMAAGGVALLVAVAYVVSMICCAAIGAAVGAPRMAYYTGLLLGLFFGPLGVFAAFAIDKRPQCPNCYSRLGGLARQCPACHAHLTWAMEMRWY